MYLLGLTDQYRSSNLEYGRQDASLRQREHLGADAGAERVGHVVGADAERQDERNHKPTYHQPNQLFRVRFHITFFYFAQQKFIICRN